jgi:hypothetical protein
MHQFLRTAILRSTVPGMTPENEGKDPAQHAGLTPENVVLLARYVRAPTSVQRLRRVLEAGPVCLRCPPTPGQHGSTRRRGDHRRATI